MYVAPEAAMMSRLANTVNHRPRSTCRANRRVRITPRGFPDGGGAVAGELLPLASNTMVARDDCWQLALARARPGEQDVRRG